MVAMICARNVVLGALIVGAMIPCRGAFAAASGLSQAEIRQIFPDLAPAPGKDLRYRGLVARVARYLRLDAGLIDAVIARESNYQPDAVSASGAIGLMQLMPGGGAIDAYAHLYGRAGRPTKTGLKRPDVNIWLGSAYLRLLQDRYYAAYAPAARMPLILAAYNWGIGHMLRNPPDRKRIQTRADALVWINSRCPDETRQYVRRVLSWYDKDNYVHSMVDESFAVRGAQ